MNLGFDETLRAAQAGEAWALGELYKALQPRLLRYLTHRDPQAAEDLASETWIKAARALDDFYGGEIEFRAWLFTIARRSLIDLGRRQRRRPEHLAEQSELGAMRAATDTEEIAAEQIGTDATLRLIAQLPPDQADVVLLRVVAGLDATRVGLMMGRRPGSIRVLQHRALRQLAVLLQASDELDEGARQ